MPLIERGQLEKNKHDLKAMISLYKGFYKLISKFPFKSKNLIIDDNLHEESPSDFYQYNDFKKYYTWNKGKDFSDIKGDKIETNLDDLKLKFFKLEKPFLYSYNECQNIFGKKKMIEEDHSQLANKNIDLLNIKHHYFSKKNKNFFLDKDNIRTLYSYKDNDGEFRNFNSLKLALTNYKEKIFASGLAKNMASNKFIYIYLENNEPQSFIYSKESEIDEFINNHEKN